MNLLTLFFMILLSCVGIAIRDGSDGFNERYQFLGKSTETNGRVKSNSSFFASLIHETLLRGLLIAVSAQTFFQ